MSTFVREARARERAAARAAHGSCRSRRCRRRRPCRPRWRSAGGRPSGSMMLSRRAPSAIRSVDVEPLVVGPAMGDGIEHRQRDRRVDAPCDPCARARRRCRTSAGPPARVCAVAALARILVRQRSSTPSRRSSEAESFPPDTRPRNPRCCGYHRAQCPAKPSPPDQVCASTAGFRPSSSPRRCCCSSRPASPTRSCGPRRRRPPAPRGPAARASTATDTEPGRYGSGPRGALERRHGGRLPARLVCPGDVRGRRLRRRGVHQRRRRDQRRATSRRTPARGRRSSRSPPSRAAHACSAGASSAPNGISRSGVWMFIPGGLPAHRRSRATAASGTSRSSRAGPRTWTATTRSGSST